MDDPDVERLEKRIDSMQNRAWWLFGLLLPAILAGVVAWANTQNDVDSLGKADRLQTKALNWQTKAIDAIAKRLDVSDQLPERPSMIEERDER